MRDKRHVIWSSLHLDMEKWRPDLETDYPGRTEDEYFSLMNGINRGHLGDEIATVYGLDIVKKRQAVVER